MEISFKRWYDKRTIAESKHYTPQQRAEIITMLARDGMSPREIVQKYADEGVNVPTQGVFSILNGLPNLLSVMHEIVRAGNEPPEYIAKWKQHFDDKIEPYLNAIRTLPKLPNGTFNDLKMHADQPTNQEKWKYLWPYGSGGRIDNRPKSTYSWEDELTPIPQNTPTPPAPIPAPQSSPQPILATKTKSYFEPGKAICVGCANSVPKEEIQKYGMCAQCDRQAELYKPGFNSMGVRNPATWSSRQRLGKKKTDS